MLNVLAVTTKMLKSRGDPWLIPSDISSLFGFLSGAGVYQWSSTFWPAPQPFARVQRPTLPHLKEGSQDFHLSSKTAISY